MDIGTRLRELRLAKGLSEADLETRTGISGNHIAAVEEGKDTPTLDTLEAWARGLGVEMHQLFIAGKHCFTPLLGDSVATLTSREAELIWVFRSLSPDDQEDLLHIGGKMMGLDPGKGGS